MVALARTNSGTVSLAESTTGWTGDTFALEPDIKVEGSNSVACAQTNNGTNDLYFAGSWNLSGGQHIRLFWNCAYVGYFSATNPVQVFLSDGTNTDYFTYFSTTGIYTGGWADLIVAVNSTNFPTVTLSSVTQVGIRVNTSAKPRNVPANVWCDNWRYADGIEITSSTTEAVSFQDAADSDKTNEYYLFKDVDGVLFAPCELVLGSTGSANANIVSLNETIVFPDRNVTSSLYKIKSQEGTGNTDIDISGLVCKTVGGSGAELDFSSSLNTFSLVSSTFIGMGSMTFTPTTASPVLFSNGFTSCGTTSLGIAADTCVFTESGQITTSGTGGLTDCTIDSANLSANTAAVVCDNLSDVSSCDFTRGTNGHAVELTVASGTMSWSNTLSGYAAGSTGSPVTPTSNGNEALYVSAPSGTVTIQVAAGATTPSIRSAGATVNVATGGVTIDVNVKDQAGSPVVGAFVYIDDDLGVAGEIANVTTNASGNITQQSYSGAASSATLRVRKYGFKPFVGTISLGSNSATNVTLITDPQQT